MDNIETAIERWGVFELCLKGPSEGNPFVEQWLRGSFLGKNEQVSVNGFYDGDGIYRIRFMPSFCGPYQYEVVSSFSDTLTGEFHVKRNCAHNHGPVHTHGCHFEYADGTPFHPVGTTCYAWTMQAPATQESTLQVLSQGYFNKLRMCVFPKHYLHNLHEPLTYPYVGTPCTFQGEITGNFMRLMEIPEGNSWDFTRFNPIHFQNLERRIVQLGQMGIEADIILFHAYDRWGFSKMTPEQNAHYLRYITARLSAYRNVWWSMANEYDLLRHLSTPDWEYLAQILCANDPYHHLRSIHNCFAHYDHSRPWITHCSIQREDVYKCAEYVQDYRMRYGKPVVLDEIAYEGNIDQGWGNISAQELVRRFWETTCRGGYATHGETYLGHETLWWSHGGLLFGESQARIRFLREKILATMPGPGLKHISLAWDEVAATIDSFAPSGYYLIYYGFFRPSYREFYFDDMVSYRVELIDTWEMTIRDCGIFRGHFRIAFPGKEYMAVRISAQK